MWSLVYMKSKEVRSQPLLFLINNPYHFYKNDCFVAGDSLCHNDLVILMLLPSITANFFKRSLFLWSMSNIILPKWRSFSTMLSRHIISVGSSANATLQMNKINNCPYMFLLCCGLHLVEWPTWGVSFFHQCSLCFWPLCEWSRSPTKGVLLDDGKSCLQWLSTWVSFPPSSIHALWRQSVTHLLTCCCSPSFQFLSWAPCWLQQWVCLRNTHAC